MIYSAYQKKSLHFLKVPPYKYFQEIFIHVGSYGSLLSNDTNKSDDIVCLSERFHVCEIDQNPSLTGIGICFGCYQQN